MLAVFFHAMPHTGLPERATATKTDDTRFRLELSDESGNLSIHLSTSHANLLRCALNSQHPGEDPVPCSECNNPISPNGPSLCTECMERHAGAIELQNRQLACDICDTPTTPKDAGEVVVTCKSCFHDPAHKIDTAILSTEQ